MKASRTATIANPGSSETHAVRLINLTRTDRAVLESMATRHRVNKLTHLLEGKHRAAGSPKPRIGMGQNWEPVLTEDELKVALAQKAEARLTAGELENRLKEIQARLKSVREQATP
jgi:hypothetical protein